MSSEARTEPTEAEIAAKTGFGETAEEAEASQEDAAGTEEETENNESDAEGEADESADTKDEKESDDSSSDADDAQKGADDDSKGESDDAADSDDAEDESDEDESEEEDEDDDADASKGKKRTVPYSKLKAKNLQIKELKAQLKAKTADHIDAEEAGDEDASADTKKELESAAKSLADELGMDEKGTKKLLDTVLKFASKGKTLPKDLEERLKILEKLEKKDLDSQEVAHFNKEWDSLDLKKAYPTATKAAITEAKELMDKLSHSKDHHKHDLDYILYKNKAKFDTILKLAGSSKSGEKGKRVGKEADADKSDDDEELVDIEQMTPAIMKQRETRELDRRRGNLNSKHKDYKIFNPKRDE